MALIGISGKIGSGKDTVGIIIQYLVCKHKDTLAPHQQVEDLMEQLKLFGLAPYSNKSQSSWEIKKFAGKLKQIVSILTGCSVEDLERPEFKSSLLGEEWAVNPRFSPAPEEGKPIEDSPSVIYTRDIYTYRGFLQKVGTDALRSVIHENVWVNALFSNYKGEFNQYHEDELKSRAFPNWIITDMRFPNELKAVEDRDGITIRINRKIEFEGVIVDMKDMSIVEHPSETALDNAKFKYVIDNDGTVDELVEKVAEILKKENII